MREVRSDEIGNPAPGALAPTTHEDCALYHWLKAQEAWQNELGRRVSLRVYAWYRDGHEPPGQVWHFGDLRPTEQEQARGFVPSDARPVDTEPAAGRHFKVQGHYLYRK